MTGVEAIVTDLTLRRPPGWWERVNDIRDWQREQVEKPLRKVALSFGFAADEIPRVVIRPDLELHLMMVQSVPSYKLSTSPHNIDFMPRAHLEAWIAHELAHVRLGHLARAPGTVAHTSVAERRYLSREELWRREFAADALAADQGYRDGLIAGLRRVPSSMGGGNSTHPSPTDRVERLVTPL